MRSDARSCGAPLRSTRPIAPTTIIAATSAMMAHLLIPNSASMLSGLGTHPGARLTTRGTELVQKRHRFPDRPRSVPACPSGAPRTPLSPRKTDPMPAPSRRSRGWSRAHAERLLWRAGFGARPKEIEFWARRSRERTVDWLIRGGAGPHGTKRMVGPPPRANGKPLDPVNEWGHDMLWWLDKMVRSQRPLQEKLTLFWHDHFATRDQDAPLMLAQNRKLRQHALGTFPELLRAVTTDPAMQAFLSLVDSDKREPNENYARELMELFTLGVTGGYTERDVREAARALTGFKGNWHDGPAADHLLRPRAPRRRRQAAARPPRAPGLAGRAAARRRAQVARALPRGQALGLLHHRAAAAGDAQAPGPRLRALAPPHRARSCARSSTSRALYADLDHPQMVKWPIVQLAGNLRMVGRAVDTDDWAWISSMMGQMPFSPPSVAGWDWGPAWMSTATMRARFLCATWICKDLPVKVTKGSVDPKWSARRAGRARPRRHRPALDEQGDRPRARAHGPALPDHERQARRRRARPTRPSSPSRPCATCCSPAPTPASAERPMHCDDFSRTDAERRSRLRGADQPPAPAAGRPRRDHLALRGARDAARARLRGRRGQRGRRRPTRRCSSTSSSPAAWTCSTRWSPATPTGATPTCARR